MILLDKAFGNQKHKEFIFMRENVIPFGREKRKPIWKDLLEVEEKINTAIKRIDASGADFLARDEILNQLRKKI